MLQHQCQHAPTSATTRLKIGAPAITAQTLDLYEIMAAFVAPLQDRLEKAESELAELRANAAQHPGADKLLTAAEAASLMKVHQSTVHRWLKAGRLKNYGAGRNPRIMAADLAKVSIYTQNSK